MALMHGEYDSEAAQIYGQMLARCVGKTNVDAVRELGFIAACPILDDEAVSSISAAVTSQPPTVASLTFTGDYTLDLFHWFIAFRSDETGFIIRMRAFTELFDDDFMETVTEILDPSPFVPAVRQWIPLRQR